MNSTTRVVYGGLATYGKINVIIGTIVSSIIVIILLIIGVKMFLTKDTQTAMISGIINNMSIHYIVDDKHYAIELVDKTLVNGQTVNVLYDPLNPSDARLSSQLSKKSFGGVLIVIAVGMAIISGLVLYFTLKYKEFATIEGGFSAVGQIGSLFG